MNTKLQKQNIEAAEVASRSSGHVLSDTGHAFSGLEAVNDAKITSAPGRKRNSFKPAVAIKNIGLFFASPFVALAYVFALPFVGMYMFSKLAMEARTRRS